MPPMDRDPQGRCRRKNGLIAGQSLNAKNPPHDTPFPFRTTVERAAQYDKLVRNAGCRSRPEAVIAGIELVAALLGITALPSWVEITDVKSE